MYCSEVDVFERDRLQRSLSRAILIAVILSSYFPTQTLRSRFGERLFAGVGFLLGVG